MRAYRIKHKKTGLYYQSANGRNNLSEKGKVYLTKQNPLNTRSNYITIVLLKDSSIYKNNKEMLYELELCRYDSSKMKGRLPKEDFEIEYL